ncbi:MAG: class I SAM-dependent methyltransferase [Bacteroidales bacterium]|nr:class I SAM-dependent methyltransferase [Bacteroidales bacterium]
MKEIAKNKDLRHHWNKKYTKTPDEQLGWYETDLSKTIELIEKTNLNKDSNILIIGAGTTTLIDELLKKNYTNITATDISEVALQKLKDRINTDKVKFIIDDLTKPKEINKIQKVDLWIDRAVLHFFTEKKDRETYFNLLKRNIKSNGFALIAQFNTDGAETCSGLPVFRYNKEMLVIELGKEFDLTESFNHTYIMPSGNERPYIYTLFKKK